MSGLDLDVGSSTEVLPAGTLIGSYRLLELLGEGGMGRVYVAEHVKLGRRVAMKMLRTEYAGNPVATSRFFAEARAVNRISHENIVEITDFLESHSCYIMELLRGEDLGLRLLRLQHLSLASSLEIAAQIASALTSVHDAGIIHRDLKPDNIFLIERGGSRNFVKLLDFGVAKLIEVPGQSGGISTHTTAQGQIIGTPEYMSPEQAAGQPVDHRTDIYALGVILYELVTGGLPFSAKSFGELVIKHMTVAPKRPSTIVEIPEPLDELIVALLAKDPGDRPQSMADVETKLREIYEALGVPVSVRTTGSMRNVRIETGPVRKETGPVRKHTPEAISPTLDAAPGGSGRIPVVSATPASGPIESKPVTLDEMVPRRPWMLLSVLALGVAVALVLVVWITTWGGEDKATTAVAPATAPTITSPPPRAPAPPAQVRIKFTSVPAGATVTIAGSDRVLGTTPFVAPLDRSDGAVRVELSRPGYETVTEEIGLASDGVFAISLAPAQPVAKKPDKTVKKSTNQTKTKSKPLDRGGTMDVFGGK